MCDPDFVPEDLPCDEAPDECKTQRVCDANGICLPEGELKIPHLSSDYSLSMIVEFSPQLIIIIFFIYPSIKNITLFLFLCFLNKVK